MRSIRVKRQTPPVPAACGFARARFRRMVSYASLAAAPALFSAATARSDEDNGFTYWGDYHVSPGATLIVDSGVVTIAGDFDVAIDDAARFDFTNVTLQFMGLSGAGPYEIETMGEDIGFCDLTLPSPPHFSIKTLRIGPGAISAKLVDNRSNGTPSGQDALYVQTLVFESGTSLDVAGLHIYYDTIVPADAGAPGSNVTITDSVGVGGLVELGTNSPDGPTGAAASDPEICVGDSTDLTATVGVGLVVDWYTGDCGVDSFNQPLGTLVGTGSPLTVSPIVTTTYYAQARDPGTGCLSHACDPVTVTVHDNPLCTITTTGVVCTNAVGLTASVENAGAGATYAWTVLGGAITAGDNTDAITFTSDDSPLITIEVTVTNVFGCDTTCQTTASTDGYSWTGLDGGSFTDAGNWNPGVVPGTDSPGGDALLIHAGAGTNRCILSAPGERIVCGVRIEATGSGRQVLRIESPSKLTTTTATTVNVGGHIDLAGGELAGGPLNNNSNSLSGYGLISSDLSNAGSLTARPDALHILRLTGSSVVNQPTGLIRAAVGSLLLVQSGLVDQSGRIEIQSLSGLVLDTSLSNHDGGLIELSGGALSADGITNEPGGLITGFGTIQSSVVNNGTIVTIADAQIVGDLQNDGTIIIQNGLLTVTGTVSGSGTIIGGFGGG